MGPKEVVEYMNPELGERQTQQFSEFQDAVMQLGPSGRATAAQLVKQEWING